MQRLIIEEKDGIVNVDARDVEDIDIYIELLAEAVEKLERISFLSKDKLIERISEKTTAGERGGAGVDKICT